MAFEGLSEKLAASFKKLRARGHLTEADVKDAMREVRLALLEADVSFKVAKDFTNKVSCIKSRRDCTNNIIYIKILFNFIFIKHITYVTAISFVPAKTIHIRSSLFHLFHKRGS